METNAKIKAEQIFKDLCKIITAPSGQDARVSDIDKLVAKNCAVYLVDELIKEQTMWQNGEVNPVLYWQEVKEVKKEINLINN